MSENTKIAWCDSTLNFWNIRNGEWHRRESAVKEALRLNAKPWICDTCGEAYKEKPFACCGTAEFHRRRIFSLSLGDWLEGPPTGANEWGVPVGGIPVEWRAEMLDTIRRCPDVEWILCSKRPENFDRRIQEVIESQERMAPLESWLTHWAHDGSAPKNITLLTSVEDQATADERIPALLRIPAARRGLSLEPLLGPVVLPEQCNPANPGDPSSCCDPSRCFQCGIDWLIIGGESGPNARPCLLEWIRSLVDQGKSAGVSTFVKQLGAWPCGNINITDETPPTMIALRDRKGADPSEWPEDLRVQCWPKGMA